MLFEEYKINTDFRPGDIVNWNRWQDHILDILPSCSYNGLFKISEIKGDKVTLSYVFKDVDRSELSPVPMDSVADKDIYWDPIVAASIIMPGQSIPVYHKIFDYYLESIDEAYMDMLKGQKFSDLTKIHGFRYVHELQHYLTSHTGDRLEINK